MMRLQTSESRIKLDQNMNLPRIPSPESLDILDCFEDPELARKTFAKPSKLIDLSVIPDEEIQTHKSIALLELIQKPIRVRDVCSLLSLSSS